MKLWVRFGQPRQEECSPEEELKRVAKRAWAGAMSALLLADLYLTATNDHSRWRDLVDRCLAKPAAPAEVAAPSPAPAPPGP